ncbi:BnaCnng20690D [Brassica napus]|uniref:BnaCnng20690D protein n=1 Tax=Brassica napus TaxID=3708 RepID=A0A078IN32_BRANA|nr:BnaCnng20690D [Brassica napus]
MGDKEKNQYTLWNSEETKVLIELLVEGIQRGWRDSNGIMNKATVEHKILPVLNERLGCQKTHKHYLSRIKFLKGQYQYYVDLLNNSSGFGWNPIMKRFVASNKVWNDYLKGHPNHKFLRYDSSEQFDDLKIIFECATANVSSAIGLGDTTDARVFTVGECQVQDNLNFEDINDDVYAQQSSPENGVKRRVEKLASRKRSRSDASSSAGHPNHKFLRYDSSEQFDDLKIIFDCATANGSSSIGLGDTTDARVFTVGDSQAQENLNFEDISDDVYVQQPSPENVVKRRVEKLVSRKRSRTDASSSSVEINTDQSDAMVMMTSKILTFIQQREERQQKEVEKREAEKKKNSVWDAMKEVPNLDDRIKFKAVTLIYSLGMKDVFTDMSIEERYGWIQSNVNYD